MGRLAAVAPRAARPLLVGEVNPRSDDSRLALHAVPAGAAGSRLAKILGLTRAGYLRQFDRENLCRGAWDRDAARARADLVFLERGLAGCPVVLLGARVAAAFGAEFRPFHRVVLRRQLKYVGGGGELVELRALMLPHPSGRCRAWNDPSAASRARCAVGCLLAASGRGRP